MDELKRKATVLNATTCCNKC